MSKPLCYVFIWLSVAGGCTSQLPPVADEQTATTSLTTALEAWKQGNTPESLEEQTPPIYVNEQLWSKDVELVDYSIVAGALNGQGWNCEVDLTVRQPNGQTKQRRIDYRIDTHPNIVIVQQP